MSKDAMAVAIIVLVIAVGMLAYQNSRYERPSTIGESLGSAIERTGDAIEDAGEDIKDDLNRRR